jgi:predicted RNase H-like HicB family nuclease
MLTKQQAIDIARAQLASGDDILPNRTEESDTAWLFAFGKSSQRARLVAKVGWQGIDGRRILATFEVHMHFTIEHEQETDGRWLAEVPELPGVLAYGATENEAMAKAQALALRVLAERLEHDETGPQPISIAVA